MKTHRYTLRVTWTGNRGAGTTSAAGYDRNHTISATNKPDIAGSSDTPFRGDGSRHNPEDMLVASLSACHMLWYLHLCADAGIVVTAYTDNPEGSMEEDATGGGRFTQVVLRPSVTVKEPGMIDGANAMHAAAHRKCFIANSCNFPVRQEPVCNAEAS